MTKIQENDARSWLPQQPPFVMIDRLTEVTDVHTQSQFFVAADNIFVSDGRLVAEALIETMAQTCAARLGYLNSLDGMTEPTIGYIGAVKGYNIMRCPRVGETVTVDVDITGQVFNMFLTQSTARVGEEVVASAEMKIAVTQDTIKPQ